MTQEKESDDDDGEDDDVSGESLGSNDPSRSVDSHSLQGDDSFINDEDDEDTGIVGSSSLSNNNKGESEGKVAGIPPSDHPPHTPIATLPNATPTKLLSSFKTPDSGSSKALKVISWAAGVVADKILPHTPEKAPTDNEEVTIDFLEEHAPSSLTSDGSSNGSNKMEEDGSGEKKSSSKKPHRSTDNTETESPSSNSTSGGSSKGSKKKSSSKKTSKTGTETQSPSSNSTSGGSSKGSKKKSSSKKPSETTSVPKRRSARTRTKKK